MLVLVFLLCVSLWSLVVPSQGWSATRLGLHITQEELTVWRTRMASGPYRVSGDVSTNSPGNWNDIVSNKNTFNSNPAANHWVGQTTNTCVTPGALFVPGPDNNPNLGRNLLHAAFYTLVANDTATGGNVRDELLALAAESGLNFANTSRWCRDGNSNDANPYFMIAIWSNQMFFAYDYLKAADEANGTTMLSAANKSTLDTWFQGMGSYWTWLCCGSASEFFVDRSGENYALTGAINTTVQGILYYGGPNVIGFHAVYNNRRSAAPPLLAAIGLVYNDTEWNRCAKRWWKEWIRYGIWPDGTPQDFVRGTMGDGPSSGWGYSAGQVTQMSAMADMYARAGDLELINYSTSEGTHGTEGGPKTLKLVVKTMGEYATHIIQRYATTLEAEAGNPNYLYDFRDENNGEHMVGDSWFALVNLYFHIVDQTTADFIQSVYLRQAPDQLGGTIPAYPASPTSNTYAWGGSAGTWPAIPFMFGQMEGAVNPYAPPATTVPIVLRLVQ